MSIRQPLTGEIVESEDDLETRAALVVKIDNNDASARRNHSGLAVADIVFEEIVEGDTRFAAVFHTQGSEPVGPIRSGREQDVEMLSSFNEPLFAWSGGNAGVTRLIASSFLTDLNVQRGGEGYFRGPGSVHRTTSTTRPRRCGRRHPRITRAHRRASSPTSRPTRSSPANPSMPSTSASDGKTHSLGVG